MVDENFASIVLEHVRRYPLMQPADLYKLAHQAALGSEHAVRNQSDARTRLERELAEMGSGPTEPLIDAISGDGRILRCHLRPYVQAEYDPEQLLTAFFQTARKVRGSHEELRVKIEVIIALSQTKRIQYNPNSLIEFFKQMEKANWPAVHHSDEYQREYCPAYRVIAKDFLPECLQCLY